MQGPALMPSPVGKEPLSSDGNKLHSGQVARAGCQMPYAGLELSMLGHVRMTITTTVVCLDVHHPRAALTGIYHHTQSKWC